MYNICIEGNPERRLACGCMVVAVLVVMRLISGTFTLVASAQTVWKRGEGGAGVFKDLTGYWIQRNTDSAPIIFNYFFRTRQKKKKSKERSLRTVCNGPPTLVLLVGWLQRLKEKRLNILLKPVDSFFEIEILQTSILVVTEPWLFSSIRRRKVNCAFVLLGACSWATGATVIVQVAWYLASASKLRLVECSG